MSLATPGNLVQVISVAAVTNFLRSPSFFIHSNSPTLPFLPLPTNHMVCSSTCPRDTSLPSLSRVLYKEVGTNMVSKRYVRWNEAAEGEQWSQKQREGQRWRADPLD